MTEDRLKEIKALLEKEHFFMRNEDWEAMNDLVQEVEKFHRMYKVKTRKKGMKIVELFAAIGAFPTHGEMRRLCYQGGVKINDEVLKGIHDIEQVDILDGNHTVQIGKSRLYYVHIRDGELKNWDRYEINR